MQDPLGGINFGARGYTQRTELAGALRAAHERLGGDPAAARDPGSAAPDGQPGPLRDHHRAAMMLLDQAAALAAHERIRVALPVSVHRLEDDDSTPAIIPRQYDHDAPGRFRRPAWLPAVGERCVIVAGKHAGARGVCGKITGAADDRSVMVFADTGATLYPRIDFVQLEGVAVPAVVVKRRQPSREGYQPGDALRIIGGRRAGLTGTYLHSGGHSAAYGPTVVLALPDGRTAHVLAKYVRAEAQPTAARADLFRFRRSA